MVALVATRPRRIIKALYEAQRGICPACGHKMPPLGDPTWPQLMPSVDHVTARAKGGGDHIGNMLAMHRGCNSAKGDRAPTGCELIWHHMVLARLELHPADIVWPQVENTAMADAMERARTKQKSRAPTTQSFRHALGLSPQ